MPTIDVGRLGKRLRYYRQSQNMTQTELANLTGYSQNYISSLERGAVASPDPAILFALGVRLGLEPNQIAEMAGWWESKKKPEIPAEMQRMWDRFLALPKYERDPLFVVFRRAVEQTEKEL